MSKDARVDVRCSTADKALFKTAATAAGLDVSEWLRQAGYKQAQLDLGVTVGTLDAEQRAEQERLDIAERDREAREAEGFPAPSWG